MNLSFWRRWAPAVLAGLTAHALAAGEAPDTLRPWNEYRTILWMNDRAYRDARRLELVFQRLREMGVNTAMVSGGATPEPVTSQGFPYYVENLVNRGLCLKFNSRVTNWERFITDWSRTRDEAAWVRDEALGDPVWRGWARQTVQSAVSRHFKHGPLAYNLRDELSVTCSANPFDYDFAPITLAQFREWLRSQYGGLGQLNRQWQTAFGSWEAVRPFSTDQIKARLASGEAQPAGEPDWTALRRLRFDPATAAQEPTRWNTAPWADFRTFMDVSLADTLADLRQAARTVDTRTPVGIEGTQMPAAFGGYDLWRLAQVLDWVEPYDLAESRAIFGSFMPGKPLLTTVFESASDPALRRLWHLLLLGDRGCIVWWSEDCLDWNAPDLVLTPKARALAPVLKEMTSPLARVFLRAERQYDPIAILYSQPSIQVDWLLESCADGATWPRRFSSYEASHNRMARVRSSWLEALLDLGFTPRFVSSAQVEADELVSGRYQVLILPTAYALSDDELRKVQEFLTSPGNRSARVVLADGMPGVFDEHGALRMRSPLTGIFAPLASERGCQAVQNGQRPAEFRAGDMAAYVEGRRQAPPDLAWAVWLSSQLPLRPEVEVTCAGLPAPWPRVTVHRYRLGSARLVALERNIHYQMSEDLKQAGGNDNLERPLRLDVRFPQPACVYNLGERRYLGHIARVDCELSPWRPVLLALLPEPVPPEKVLDRLLPP